MGEILFIISMVCLIVVTVVFCVWLCTTNSTEKTAMFARLFNPSDFKLPFNMSYPYKLYAWDKGFERSKQYRNIRIDGKVTNWYGELHLDVLENGLWGYETFILKGVGTAEGLKLTPNTDLISLLQEGKTIAHDFKEYDVNLVYDRDMKARLEGIENKINNLKVIERLTEDDD